MSYYRRSHNGKPAKHNPTVWGNGRALRACPSPRGRLLRRSNQRSFRHPPRFDQYMRDSQSRGLTFAPFIGKRNIGFNEMSQPIPDGEEFRIAPIIIGNKKGGLFQTILGAAMIVAGVVASFIPGGQAVSPYLVAAGISTAAGGVMQMLSPQSTGMRIRRMTPTRRHTPSANRSTRQHKVTSWAFCMASVRSGVLSSAPESSLTRYVLNGNQRIQGRE